MSWADIQAELNAARSDEDRLTVEQADQVQLLAAEGFSVEEIATALSLGLQVVTNAVRRTNVIDIGTDKAEPPADAPSTKPAKAGVVLDVRD
jgi:transposase